MTYAQENPKAPVPADIPLITASLPRPLRFYRFDLYAVDGTFLATIHSTSADAAAGAWEKDGHPAAHLIEEQD